VLCTPEWFSSNMRDEIATGRHHLFVRDFSYPELEKFVQDYCSSCGEEATWGALAEKLARLGKWEFEDYVPHVEPPIMRLSRPRFAVPCDGPAFQADSDGNFKFTSSRRTVMAS
jgi:hypothetical protein